MLVLLSHWTKERNRSAYSSTGLETSADSSCSPYMESLKITTVSVQYYGSEREIGREREPFGLTCVDITVDFQDSLRDEAVCCSSAGRELTNRGRADIRRLVSPPQWWLYMWLELLCVRFA